jgi:TPP-dependent pyruvate/acetoin dehydrogenase alpha subunit
MVAATGVRAQLVDGRDVLAVRATAEELLETVRSGEPAFMECAVFRVRPHSIADPDYRYRPRGAGDEWLQTNDPIVNLAQALEPVAADKVRAIDDEVIKLVDESLAEAERASQTPAVKARVNIYATEELEELD